jgi:hypothetical protein
MLVVALLFAVVAGLYLQLVTNKENSPGAPAEVSQSAASVLVLEGDEPAPQIEGSNGPAQPLPEDQMAMIMRVFAPEGAE